jgi:hypothetical protein
MNFYLTKKNCYAKTFENDPKTRAYPIYVIFHPISIKNKSEYLDQPAFINVAQNIKFFTINKELGCNGEVSFFWIELFCFSLFKFFSKYSIYIISSDYHKNNFF